MAVIDVAFGAPIEKVRAELANELKESWKLYAAGTLRETCATAAPTRIVFVVETLDDNSA
jgi:hypothetical protein